MNYGWIDQWGQFVADPSLLSYSSPYGIAKAQSCTSPAANGNWVPPPYTPTQSGQWGQGGWCLAGKVAASGSWCPSSQPEYSRWRQDAFGVG